MPNDVARILVTRPRSVNGAIWSSRWVVIMDGEKYGSLGNGESLGFDLSAGRHVIRVAPTVGFKSAPFELTLQKGEEVELMCRLPVTANRPRIERRGGISLRTMQESDRQAPVDIVQPSTSPAPRDQIVEVSRTEIHIGDETLLIDNSQSASPSLRVKRLTKEWTRSYTLDIGRSSTVGGGGGLNVQFLQLKAQAERAIAHKYSATAEERQTYDEEVTITVGPRTNSRIVFSWKEIRQNGYIVIGTSSEDVRIPFDVVVGVTFDQRQVDVVT